MQAGAERDVIPKSKYLLALASATFVVGVLQASGAVDFPFAQWFSHLTGSLVSFSTLNSFMSKYGYASLFALMALESASVPIPSEVVLPYAGYLVFAGTLSFWPVILVSTVASIFGALVDYYLAVWLGRPFVTTMLKALRVRSGSLERAESWFERSGQWTVFAARFVPLLRALISLPAGLFRMKRLTFVAMTAAGSVAWTIILVYAGYLAGGAGQSLGNAFASSSTVSTGLSGLVAAVSAAYIAFYAYAEAGRRRVTRPASGS